VIRLAAAIWTLAIVVACLLPGSDIPTWEFLPLSVDKVVHLAMFFGFGALWAQSAPGRMQAVFWSGLALGVAIELLQGALPIGRSMDPLDALADLVGLGLGMALVRWTRRTA